MSALPLTPPAITDLKHLPKIGKAPKHKLPNPDNGTGIPGRATLVKAHKAQFDAVPDPQLRNQVKTALSNAFENDRLVPHTEDPASTDPALRAGKLALDEVFRWILSAAQELINDINATIVNFQKADTQETRDAYTTAVLALDDFQNKLNAQHNGAFYGPAIKTATIEPILSGGFIVAANVNVQWNGTHSDGSTIHK